MGVGPGMEDSQNIALPGQSHDPVPGKDIATFTEMAGYGHSGFFALSLDAIYDMVIGPRVNGWPRDSIKGTGINADKIIAIALFNINHLHQQNAGVSD